MCGLCKLLTKVLNPCILQADTNPGTQDWKTNCLAKHFRLKYTRMYSSVAVFLPCPFSLLHVGVKLVSYIASTHFSGIKARKVGNITIERG